MKKRCLIAVFLLLISMSTLVLSACEFGVYYEVQRDRIAKERYGMEEILCKLHVNTLWGFTADGKKLSDDNGEQIPEQEYLGHFNFYLGIKDGEEIAIIFPHLHSQKIRTSKWVFDCSFMDTVALLNSDDRGEVYKFDEYVYFDMLDMYQKDDMVKLVPEVKDLHLDIEIMLLYKDKYAIVQADGEVLIFEIAETNQQESV